MQPRPWHVFRVVDQKDDEEERFLRDIPTGVEMCRGIGVVHHFSHTTRGRTVFAVSPPVHHPDNALKDRYLPRNQPGTRSYRDEVKLKRETYANFKILNGTFPPSPWKMRRFWIWENANCNFSLLNISFYISGM